MLVGRETLTATSEQRHVEGDQHAFTTTENLQTGQPTTHQESNEWSLIGKNNKIIQNSGTEKST